MKTNDKNKPVEKGKPEKELKQRKKNNQDNAEEPALELDERLRNDIEQTEINLNLQKRKPITKEGQTEEEQQLNQDLRTVNEQEDDIKKNKYNGL